MNADGSNQVQIAEGSEPHWGKAPQTSGTDSDGISPAIEAAAPNNGDANNDGIADTAQANVSSFVNPVTNSYVAVQSTCTSNSSVGAAAESTGFKDAGFDYPAGLVAFTLACGNPGAIATVSVFFYAPPSQVVARKYNSTTHAYQALTGATLQYTTIGGQAVLKVSYTVTDGGSLDQDATPNGTIVDPVGLGQSVVGAPRSGLGGSSMQKPW